MSNLREEVMKITGGYIPPIIHVAEQMGFSVDRRESSRNITVMRIGQPGGGEKLLIYKDRQTYRNCRTGKGGDAVALTLEDSLRSLYCGSREWKDWYAAWRKNYGRGLENRPEKYSGNKTYEADRVVFRLGSYEIKPFDQNAKDSLRSYLLNDRCIDSVTLGEVSPFIREVKDLARGQYNGKDIPNIGFPICPIGSDEIKGFELKNRNYKRNAAGSDISNCVWHATRATDLTRVKRVFFFESALDAISYLCAARMKAQAQGIECKLNLDTDLLVSCGGTPKLNQILSIKSACTQAKPYACFDLDKAGNANDIVLNNYWTGQLAQVNALTHTDRKVFYETDLQNPEMLARIQQLKKNGWIESQMRTETRNVDGTMTKKFSMTQTHVVGTQIRFNGQEVDVKDTEVSLPMLAKLLPDYKLEVERHKPVLGTVIKYKDNQRIEVPVKDWNDRVIADRQERQKAIRGVAERIGVVKQRKEIKQQEKQSEIAKKIEQANKILEKESQERKEKRDAKNGPKL